MHEYSKRIAEHIKSCYGELKSMTFEDLCELEKWSKVMKDLTEYDVNKRAIEAMDEYKDMEKFEMMGGRMGYRGRAADGRFVHRSGRGRSAGFTPYIHAMPMIDDIYDDGYPDMYDNYRMGYTAGRMDGERTNRSYGYSDGGGSDGNYGGNSGGRYGYSADGREGSRYGKSYEKYRDSRRHYTQSPNPENQKMMKDSAEEVFDDIETLAKKMFSEADAQDKTKFKQKMTELVQKLQ